MESPDLLESPNLNFVYILTGVGTNPDSNDMDTLTQNSKFVGVYATELCPLACRFVLKMMNFVLQMMNFGLKQMDSAFKMVIFAFKMMD